jgi:hypothetical protein
MINISLPYHTTHLLKKKKHNLLATNQSKLNQSSNFCFKQIKRILSHNKCTQRLLEVQKQLITKSVPLLWPKNSLIRLHTISMLVMQGLYLQNLRLEEMVFLRTKINLKKL